MSEGVTGRSSRLTRGPTPPEQCQVVLQLLSRPPGRVSVPSRPSVYHEVSQVRREGQVELDEDPSFSPFSCLSPDVPTVDG